MINLLTYIKYINNIFLIVIFISCTSNGKTNEIIKQNNCDDPSLFITELEPYKTILSFNDTVVFSNYINQIITVEDDLFFSDKVLNKIFKLDKELNLISTFGKHGKGPEEISDLSNLNFDPVRQNIVVNSGNSKYLNYDLNGNFKSEYIIEDGGRYIGSEFIVNDGNFLMTTPFTQNSPQSLFYMNNNKNYNAHPFGEFWRRNDENYINLNSRHLIKSPNSREFYVIGHELPIIEIYSYENIGDSNSYKIVRSIDLTNRDLFKNYFEVISKKTETDPNKRNTINTLIRDVYINKDLIYMLVSTFGATYEEKSLDNIIVLDLKNGCMIKNIYKLNNISKSKGWYLTFAVFEDRLIAFDAISTSFHVYLLKNDI